MIICTDGGGALKGKNQKPPGKKDGGAPWVEGWSAETEHCRDLPPQSTGWDDQRFPTGRSYGSAQLPAFSSDLFLYAE